MKNKKDNLLFIVGIVFLVIVIMCLFFKSKKVKEQKEGLEAQIKKQQNFVTYILIEIAKLKQLQNDLIEQAISLYRTLRIVSVFLILATGLVCYGFYSLPFWAAITGLLGFLTIAYYTYTFIKFNKFQEFNTTFEMLENYFIVRKYKKNDFNPELISVYENKLKTETEVLNQLIENHKNKTFLLD
jgi:uncharacterized membrane protein